MKRREVADSLCNEDRKAVDSLEVVRFGRQ